MFPSLILLHWFLLFFAVVFHTGLRGLERVRWIPPLPNNPQRQCHGHKTQPPFADTSCTLNCWPTASVLSTWRSSSSSAGSRKTAHWPPRPWPSSSEPHSHAECHWCPCRRAAEDSSMKAWQASAVSSQRPTSEPQRNGSQEDLLLNLPRDQGKDKWPDVTWILLSEDAFLQSSGTPTDCHQLPQMLEKGLAIPFPAPLAPSETSHQLVRIQVG